VAIAAEAMKRDILAEIITQSNTEEGELLAKGLAL
jgi:hypothetical protein